MDYIKKCRGACVLAIIFVQFAGKAQAEINLVQDTTGITQSSTTVSATFSLPPTEGNLLVAIAGNRTGSAAPTAPTGWSVLINGTTGTPGQIIYYKIAGPSEPSTVTVGPYPITASRGLHLYEYSGVDTSSPLGPTSATNGNGTSVASGNVTTADEAVVLVAVVINKITAFSSWSSSFTEINDFINAGTPTLKTVYASAHRISYDAGTFSTTGTSDSAGSWLCHTVSFNAAVDCACTVTTVADTGAGSLRECLELANNCSRTTIEFNIAEPCNRSRDGDSWWRISPASALPIINSHLTTIDATTQTINQGDSNSRGPEIEVNGASAGTAHGLRVYTADNLIKGLAINGFGASFSSGIYLYLTPAARNSVHGCYIGTNATGDSAISNYYGVRLTTGASDNDIGGSGAGEGNLISGNGNTGVYQSSSCNNNRVRGNYIGTNATGTAAVGNTVYGLYSGVSCSGTIIGGTAVGESNLISGNGNNGVYFVGGSNSLVQGNLIGTNINGITKIPNGGAGIYLSGHSTATIGGTSAGAGNIISGNSRQGIIISGGDLCYIYGNKIGTGPSGTESGLGNDSSSIELVTSTASNTIKVGGLNAGESNIVANGARSGVYVSRKGSQIEITGNTITGHGANGIVSASDSLKIIGNLIYGNEGRGISVVVAGTNNKIYHNTIHGNGAAYSASGIRVAAAGAIIKNNIITGSGAYGIYDSLNYVTEEYNLITDDVTGPPNDSGQANISLAVSDINADPQYNDTTSGDFTLLEPNSPAINAGLNLGTDQPDMNGADPGSFNGPKPDMGAFESGTLTTLSVMLSKSTIDYGVNRLDQWLAPDSSLLINDGTIAANLLGRISQFTDGSNFWHISSLANGADSIRAQWSVTSNAGPWTDIAAYNSDFTITTNVAVSDTVIFWFQIETPVTTLSYNEHSSSLTVTAETY